MSLSRCLFRHIKTLSRHQKMAVFLATDIFTAAIAFFAMLASGSNLGSPQKFTLLVGISGLAAFFSFALGLPRIKLNAYGRHAVFVTGKFTVLVTLGMFALLEVAQFQFGPADVIEFGMLLFVGSVAVRYCMLSILLWILRQGKTRRRLLIYGAGDTGLQIALALRHHPRIMPVAFLDDDLDLQAMIVAGLPILSPTRLEKSMRDFAVNSVMLAMPSSPPAKLAQITRKLQALGLSVHALPSFDQLVGTRAPTVPPVLDLPGQFLGRSTFSGDPANNARAYAGRAILVSGAGGSVGSELCRQLMMHGPKTLVLYEQSELALYTIERELREFPQRTGVEIIPVLGSITNAGLARKTMTDAEIDVIFHAAAYKHVPLIEANPVAGLANNVIGTRVFAEAAIAARVGRFVLISSDKAVRPTGVMGATKRLAELVVQDLAVRSNHTRFSIVRFGNVLGSSGSVLPLFREQIARGGPVTLTHDKVTRYFMTLAEAAQLVLLTGAFFHNSRSADIFVLDMGQSIRIRDLAERIIKAQGLTVRDCDNPSGDIEIVVTGLRPGEKLHEELLTDGQLLSTQHPKVLRAQAIGLSEFAMASALKAALCAVESCDQDAAREVISAWVEGFPCPEAAPISDFGNIATRPFAQSSERRAVF